MARLSWIVLIAAIGLIEPLSIGSQGRVPFGSLRNSWMLPQQGRQVNVRHHRHGYNPNNIYAATVFGNGHIITYDGKYYKFPIDSDGNNCPHILSRDHIGYRFTILQNGQSITLYTPQSVITLHHHNKVEANNTGMFRDLPLHTPDNSLVVTHDNEAVTIATDIGVHIECDMTHEECVFILDGDLYNQSLGLLGTNDLDPSNDFNLRSGDVADSVQDFVNYFELTGSAFCRPRANPAPSTCGSHLSTRCHQLLSERISPLSSCFGHVDPTPYKEACLFDTNSCNVNNKPEAVCTTVRAYVKMCTIKGVTIHPPSNCGKCNGLSTGSVWSERSHQKLDVVIATSLTSDLVDNGLDIGTVIQGAFHYVEGHLRKEARVQNVRVGLMGYDGEGALDKPHVYTFQGKPFTRHYSAALWRDKLSSLTTHRQTGRADIPAVVESITQYPYRRDATKMVILIVGRQQSLSVDAEQTLSSLLTSQGIILNVLTSGDPFTTSDILGISSDSRLLTASNRNNYANFPMNLMGQLVQSTGGSLFDLNSIAAANHRALYHLGNEMSNQISHSRRQCRTCQCVVSGNNRPAQVLCDSRGCA